MCSAYTEVRSRILGEMKIVCKNSNTGIQFDEFKQNTNLLTQFILDCCSLNLPKRFNMNDKQVQGTTRCVKSQLVFILVART